MKNMEYKFSEIREDDIKEAHLAEQLDTINNNSLESLRARNEGKAQEKIKELSPFSSEINRYIRNLKELMIYKSVGLKEAVINNRDCLIKENINLEITDDFGRTNLDRMKEGLSPLDEDENSIELHHIGQEGDSPLAELTREEHRGGENNSALHKRDESKIERNQFDKERAEHWKARAEMLGG